MSIIADSPQREQRRKQYFLLIFFTLAAASFLYLACAVENGVTQTVDEKVLLGLRNADDRAQPNGPEWLLPVATMITHLGSGYALTAFVFIAVLLLVRRKQHRVAIRIAAIAIGGMIVLYAVKAGVARPRPTIVPHLIEIGEYSFPSGHAMMTGVLFLSLASLFAAAQRSAYAKAGTLASAALLSTVIGITRVYLGVHYPSDVIAGWCAGLMLFCLYMITDRWSVSSETPVNG